MLHVIVTVGLIMSLVLLVIANDTSKKMKQQTEEHRLIRKKMLAKLKGMNNKTTIEPEPREYHREYDTAE